MATVDTGSKFSGEYKQTNSTKQWTHTFSASDINGWVALNIPEYATINSATLSFNCQKGVTANKANIQILIGSTPIHSASKVVGSLDNKYYVNNLNIKDYVSTDVKNSGYISGDIKISFTSNDTLFGTTWYINDFTITYDYTPKMHHIVVNNNEGGEGHGTGTYTHSTQFTISATPYEGYKFKQWNDGNTDNPRTVIATDSVSYTPTFESLTHTITVSKSGDGDVTGSGTYNKNAQATLTATPSNGYKFVKWSDGNTSATRTITVTGDATYIATFEQITYYTVFDLNGGTLSYDNSPIARSYESTLTLGSYGFLGEEVTITYETMGGKYSMGEETMFRPLLGWEDLGSIKAPDGTVYTADTFDAPYYANKYPNLYAAYGYDKYALVSNYHTIGKDRGEQCINTEGNKERGLYTGGNQISHLTNIDGETVTLKCLWGNVESYLLAPTRDGYEFLGWSDGENTYQAGETVSLIKSTTFTAQWKPNNIFVGDTPAQGVYVGDKPAKAIYKGTTLIYEQ